MKVRVMDDPFPRIIILRENKLKDILFEGYDHQKYEVVKIIPLVQPNKKVSFIIKNQNDNIFYDTVITIHYEKVALIKQVMPVKNVFQLDFYSPHSPFYNKILGKYPEYEHTLITEHHSFYVKEFAFYYGDYYEPDKLVWEKFR